jgi:hypothetical protein
MQRLIDSREIRPKRRRATAKYGRPEFADGKSLPGAARLAAWRSVTY